MSQIKFLVDLYPIYTTFRHRLEEKVGAHLNERISLEMVTDDYFDICLNLASDAVKFVEIGEQRLMLNPFGRVRQMVNTQLQDIFFDQLAGYASECDYFRPESLDNKFIGNDVASLGVYVIDEILREVMGKVIQYPEGQMYFDSYNCTTNSDTISDLIFNRSSPRGHDIYVFLGFE